MSPVDLHQHTNPEEPQGTTVEPIEQTKASLLKRLFSHDALWDTLFKALVLIVLLRFIPLELVFRDTTPTGGDVAGHVWFPYFLHGNLPHLSGWSDDWYAGLPAGSLYFPFPALVTLLLNIVLPYGIAMKCTIALAVLVMPYAAWRFTSRLSISPFAGPAAAAATLMFQTERFHTIYGGNIASVLAGEFSCSLSFILALLALSFELDYLRDPSKGVPRVLPFIMAACAMSHVLGAMFMVVMSFVLVLWHTERVKNLRALVWPFAISFFLAAVWWIPFILGARHATDMAYEPTRACPVGDTSFLCLRQFQWLFPPSLKGAQGTTTWWFLIVPLALFAVLYGVVRRHRGVLIVASGAVAFVLMYALWPTTYVWDARWLPYYWWCMEVLAALGALLFVELVWGRIRAVTALGVLLLFIPAFAASGFIHDLPGSPPQVGTTSKYEKPPMASWAEWDFTGYEEKPRWNEYRSIMRTMADLGRTEGCSRALWEYDSDQGGYGSPMAMMLLPYWTEGCVDSVEGLFMEGSETTPFHFMIQKATSKAGSAAVRDLPYAASRDLDWGVPAMRALGVRWYMAYNDETIALASARDDLQEVARSEHWVVYEIKDWAWVAPFKATTRVTDATWPTSFADAFKLDPTGSFTTPEANLPEVSAEKLAALLITNISHSTEQTSFDVSEVGVPVVVRNSWYPSWKVSGAKGPFRAGPNMMVVVPTASHVTLTAPTPPHRGLAELVGVLALIGALWWCRTARGRRDPAAESDTDAVADDAAPQVAAASADPRAGAAESDLAPLEGEQGEDPTESLPEDPADGLTEEQ
jgi:hypothetical protein